MTDLRFQGKSDDGSHLNLVDNDGNTYSLRISDPLRASVNKPRLAAVTPHEEELLSVKEIQRRLRAGESAESIARDGNTSVDHVERFAGPILSERIWIINKAHEVHLRKESAREPFTFFEIVRSKLVPRGVDEDAMIWRTHRYDDGTWKIELSYPTSTGSGVAQWRFEVSRQSLAPEDDNARWMLGEDPAPRQPEPGLVYTETVVREPVVAEEKFDAPRLVAVREEPTASESSDGIKARAKVPSWDEIMFGIKPEETN